ncbi:hypothetical protein J6590_029253 [Homalodisca vitripennis]|nr:hypothetical protein J6590_029253 [Homalodisca vitripennis]
MRAQVKLTSITLDHRGRRRSVKSRVRLHHSTHERMRAQVKALNHMFTHLCVYITTPPLHKQKCKSLCRLRNVHHNCCLIEVHQSLPTRRRPRLNSLPSNRLRLLCRANRIFISNSPFVCGFSYRCSDLRGTGGCGTTPPFISTPFVQLGTHLLRAHLDQGGIVFCYGNPALLRAPNLGVDCVWKHAKATPGVYI